jgi:hypothetical protein
MLKKFIIFVIDDLSESGTPEEMVAIDAFNDSLRAKGQWIFAGGLAAPVHANVIDNRNGHQFGNRQASFQHQRKLQWILANSSDRP